MARTPSRALWLLAAAGVAVAALAWLWVAPAPPSLAPEPLPEAPFEQPEPGSEAAPPAGADAPGAAATPAPTATPAEPSLALDRLLTWSDPDEPRPRALRLETADDSPGAPAPGSKRWYLEQRREGFGPVNRERSRRETEAGVVVPLDESVAVRGGVRVESQEDAEAGTRKKETAPTVGVEVRF